MTTLGFSNGETIIVYRGGTSETKTITSISPSVIRVNSDFGPLDGTSNV